MNDDEGIALLRSALLEAGAAPTSLHALLTGWQASRRVRADGRATYIYLDSDGHRFRSRSEVVRHFGLGRVSKVEKKTGSFSISSRSLDGSNMPDNVVTEETVDTDHDGVGDHPANRAYPKRQRQAASWSYDSLRYDGSIVRRRVQVWWKQYRAWFGGTVREFDHLDDTHCVLYDDGDVVRHHLNDPRVEWKFEVEETVAEQASHVCPTEKSGPSNPIDPLPDLDPYPGDPCAQKWGVHRGIEAPQRWWG